MDYEKMYKEALERAREYWETDNDNTLDIKAKGTMEYLFPELAESEDEKTREEIIQFLRDYHFNKLSDKVDVDTLELWAAWLKKQGEKKPTAWSEEDDSMFQSCIGAVATNDYYKGEEKEQIYDWIKSLKQKLK